MEDGMKTPFMDLAEKSTRNADVRIVKGVGHFPMLQAAAAVNTMIDQFATRFA
jgi:pimeloyl-ACP methyl ester carboxylesterase